MMPDDTYGGGIRAIPSDSPGYQDAINQLFPQAATGQSGTGFSSYSQPAYAQQSGASPGLSPMDRLFLWSMIRDQFNGRNGGQNQTSLPKLNSLGGGYGGAPDHSSQIGMISGIQTPQYQQQPNSMLHNLLFYSYIQHLLSGANAPSQIYPNVDLGMPSIVA